MSSDGMGTDYPIVRISYNLFNPSRPGAKLASKFHCHKECCQSLRPKDLLETSLSQPLANFLSPVPSTCFSLL